MTLPENALHGAAGFNLSSRLGKAAAVAAVAVIVAVVLAPIIVIVVSSFWSAPFLQQPGQFTLANYARVLGSQRSLELLLNTTIFTVGTAVLSTAMGATLAWIVVRTRLPFPRLAAILPIFPVFLPTLLKDTSWIQLFSPQTGLVNLAINHVFGREESLFNIFSMGGMIADLSFAMTPVAYLMLIGPMGSIDRALEEASFASGAGHVRTLFRITLPVIRPALISAFALICIITACSFETPIVIGFPGGVSTYMSTIYRSMSGGTAPNFSLASAQSVFYLVLIMFLLGWYLWATRLEAKYALVSPRGASIEKLDLGGWKYLLFGIVVLYWLIAFAGLVVIAALISIMPYYTVTEGNPFHSFTLDHYRGLIADGALASVVNSLSLSAVVAVLTVACAFILSMVSVKTKWRGRRIADLVGTLPIACPPLVFSVALLITLVSVPGLSLLYNSWVPMIVASAVVFLPFAVRTLSSSLIAQPDSLTEASLASGAGHLRTMRSITIPILGPAIGGAALLVFMYSLRELAAVALLVRPGLSLVPTQIFGYLQTGAFPRANALNVVSLVLPAVLVAALLGLRQVYKHLKARHSAGRSSVQPSSATAAPSKAVA